MQSVRYEKCIKHTDTEAAPSLVDQGRSSDALGDGCGTRRGETVCERNSSGESPARQESGEASSRYRFKRYALYISLSGHRTLQNCARGDELLLIRPGCRRSIY